MEIKILNYNFSVCKVEDYSQIKLDKKLGIKKLWLNASEEGKKIYLKLGFKEKNNEMEIFI